ncbi:hypothetical protein COV11_01480 [Candidatus Woesearchaeota archaeon CG10_big_fil_rev_8_21_14_0_10_30_7]|nr:MAG: hypothetical protein COV11_01480 [Candidatus Woesearchaeota archaeon CG10_big_fil_rev_8_21_14_0_10_30_7]
MKKTICALIATLALSSCTEQTTTQPQLETLRGIPISVSGVSGDYYLIFSTMIQKDDGTYVLCTSLDRHVWGPQKATEVETLIKSEINDRDDEQLELVGKYKGDKFEFISVSANGYTIKSH